MKAVVVDPNAAGSLTISDVNEPSPLPDEAVVRVKATSLNLGEVRYSQSGDPGRQVGWDLAGIVEKAAADGTGPGEGARVVGFLSSGAWAQRAAVPVNALAELPDNVSFEEAATLPVAGLTALYVIEKGTALLGRTILVTGANGGVGTFACQIGKLYGAKVIGQVRREKYIEMVKTAGADEVVLTEDGTGAAEFGPYRLIAESVGGQVLGNVIGMLSPDGICVTYGASAGQETCFEIWRIMRTGRASLYGFLLFNEVASKPASDGLSRLAALVSDGRLKPQITIEEDWNKIGQIARDLLDRKIPGKAVLHID